MQTQSNTERAPALDLEGPIPLTPAQNWLFDFVGSNVQRWNNVVILETRQAIDPQRMRLALAAVIAHHDALRLRFERRAVRPAAEPNHWQQFVASAGGEAPFSICDLSRCSSEEEERAAIGAQIEALQASFDLRRGPLFAVALACGGRSSSGSLILASHHLVIDSTSWAVIIEDLETGYTQLGRGEPIRLPPKTTPFRVWAERMRSYARSDEILEQLGFWLSEERMHAPRLPVDFPSGARHEGSRRRHITAIDPQETKALLKAAARRYHTQVYDVLLTALVRAASRWTGASSLATVLTSHARDPGFSGVDLSRTVGWLCAGYPMLFQLDPALSPDQAVASVRRQNEAVPRQGIGYSLLYHRADPELLRLLQQLPPEDMVFNYYGKVRIDTPLFELNRIESLYESMSPDQPMPHAFQVDARLTDGRLYIDWTYSGNTHRDQTIARMADDLLESVRSMLA